jgi:hypothetical protein
LYEQYLRGIATSLRSFAYANTWDKRRDGNTKDIDKYGRSSGWTGVALVCWIDVHLRDWFVILYAPPYGQLGLAYAKHAVALRSGWWFIDLSDRPL